MGKKSALEIDGQTLEVSNLEKIFYPATGFTKGELIDYYIRMSKNILPHLRNRPLTLKRYPEGVRGPHFYEKNAPRHTPKWIKTAGMPRKNGGEEIHFVLINDVASLVWAANLASIELHILLSQASRLERPDFVVFDLDPGEPANVIQCAQVALWLRELLQDLKLESFIKSSGSKGLQLYIPLNTPCTFEQTQQFARAIAERLEREHPGAIVSKMAKELRTGKVFIDWGQNTRHKTTVCAYSLRAKREKPYVSMPIEWGNVVKAFKSDDAAIFDFSPQAALKIGDNDLFAPVLSMKQKLPANFASKLKKVAEKKTPRLRGTGDRTLKAYEAKRDFTQTKEPSTRKTAKNRQGSNPLFVIQKHRASHLHYDFRLEMNGTLKSWAVPKGVPYMKGEKRLAMHVEDHPLGYARFEGTIPPGNYGAGTVMVWDIGTYELTDGNMHAGKLHFVLNGKKLKGEWILVRGHGQQDSRKEHWFLIKAAADFPRVSARKEDSSALTGRSLEEIASENDAQWGSNRSSGLAGS